MNFVEFSSISLNDKLKDLNLFNFSSNIKVMEFSQSLSKSVAIIVSNIAFGAVFVLYGLSFFLREDVQDDSINQDLLGGEILEEIIEDDLYKIEIPSDLELEQTNKLSVQELEQTNKLSVQESKFSDYREDYLESEHSETPEVSPSESLASKAEIKSEIKSFKGGSSSIPSNGK